MVTAKERRWAIWFAIALLAITTIPYLIGFQRQGPDWRFSGFVFGTDDGNSYIAKMLRGASGDWLFRTPYTSDPQVGFLVFLPYILLGKLSAPPGQHDQLVVLFHIFRWVAALLMVLATYDFAALFLTDVRMRRWATALAVAGGGLGWLSAVGLSSLWGSRIPLEFYSPETFGFLSFYGLPHLALGRALLLWGLAGYLRAKTIRQAVRPGLCWLLLGFMQPLTIVTGWVVIAVHQGYLLVRSFIGWKESREQTTEEATDATQPVQVTSWWDQARRALVIGLISCPMVLYTAFSFLTDPYLQGWGKQNIILSPPLGDYLLAFGIFLPLAAFGAGKLFQRNAMWASLLIGWVLVFPFLAYIPYNLQRRLPEGVWVALVVLSTSGVWFFRDRWKRIIFYLLPLSFAPALFLILGGGLAAWTPLPPVFQPVTDVDAYQFMKANAPKDAAVLAAFQTSNELPAWAPVRVITGHGPESVRAEEITPRIRQFFQASERDEERLAFLQELGIRYVFYGPQERRLGSRDPGLSPFLKPVFENGGTRVYEVIP